MHGRRSRLSSTASIVVVLLVVLCAALGAEGLTPDQALAKLKDGNVRYVSDTRIYPSMDLARRQQTASEGQFPFATVIGCSDSRAPIEHIFDVGVGDIFPIRVAGNVADIDEIGSIEYGIEHLHTPILVVLGHTSCGAVTAVARGDEVGPNIASLVDNIIPAVEKAKQRSGSTFSSRLVDEAVRLNVYQTIEDLFAGSEAAVELVKEGELNVVGAIYHLDSGEVEWLGKHPSQGQLLAAGAHAMGESDAGGDGHAVEAAVALPGSVPASALGAASVSVAILIVGFFVFVSRKTGIKTLRTRGRLLLGALTMLTALAIPETMALIGQSNGVVQPSLPYILVVVIVPVAAAILFGAAVATSTSRAFASHLQMLKEKYGRAVTG